MSLSVADLMGEMDFRLPKVVQSKEEAEDGDSIVAEDGIYKLVRAIIGDFWIKAESFKTKMVGMPQLSESFTQSSEIPKIPGELFYGIIRFYRKIYETNKNEVMAQIWWDKEERKFLVEVPEQEVAGASITYQRTGGWYDDPNKVLVLTSHSHHTMGAFYSSVDNSDEKGKHGIYSFVFGNLVNKPDGTFTYKTVQRVCCADALIPLQLEDIFDFTEGCEFLFEIPEEDYAKVKAKVYNYGAYANYGKSKSKGFPYTGGQSTPANVSKIEDNYNFYSGYLGYSYGSYDSAWDSVDYPNNASTVGSSAIEKLWQTGAEATVDRVKYGYISSILRGMSKPGDELLYNDFEFKEIESIVSDFVNAVSLPETHPYYMFAELLNSFMSNLLEGLSDVQYGDREGLSKIEDPSKAFAVVIASAISGVEDSFNSMASPNSAVDLMKDHNLSFLYLPERIAAYLKDF